MNSKTPIVNISNICVTYKVNSWIRHIDSVDILKDISIDLYPGDSIGIVGKNGAGKSTLLRIIAGIIEPDKGQVFNKNVLISLLSLQLGFVPFISGRDNIMLSGMLLGLEKELIHHHMEEIITFSELHKFIDYPIKTYSSGMLARLGFSIGIHLDPDVLLIDEIFAVGDEAFVEKSSAKMEETIKSNKTIVMVSHNSEVIRRLCNKVLWIENGQTKVFGDTNETVDAYQAYLKSD